MTIQIQLIAADFSRRIREHLTAEQMSEVISQNGSETNPNICHSHDHCDANAMMAAAFEQVSGQPLDLHSDSDDSISWAAWETAKSSKFSVNISP